MIRMIDKIKMLIDGSLFSVLRQLTYNLFLRKPIKEWLSVENHTILISLDDKMEFDISTFNQLTCLTETLSSYTLDYRLISVIELSNTIVFYFEC